MCENKNQIHMNFPQLMKEWVIYDLCEATLVY